MGFQFGVRPSVCYQVDNLIRKFTKRVWQLVHLKRVGLTTDKLRTVYFTMLRPLLEYSCVVCHSMLTAELSGKLESAQRRALRIIYGFDESYEVILNKNIIEKLQTRRERFVMNFIRKNATNRRFSGDWFPLRQFEENERQLRERQQYIEFNSRTERLYNSPLFAYRRLLNSI